MLYVFNVFFYLKEGRLMGNKKEGRLMGKKGDWTRK